MARPPAGRQNLSLEQGMNLAIQHFGAGDLPAAETIVRQILKVHPNQPGAIHLLGLIAHRAGQHADAADLIAKSLKINPKDAWAHANLGIVLMELDRFEEALKACGRATEIDPNHVDAHFNMGNALRALGRLEDALDCYRKVIDLRTDHVDALSNAGVILAELGRFEEATRSYRKVISMDPNACGAYSNLGLALEKQGQNNEAEICLRQAVEIDPNYAAGHLHLGRHLNAQGRFADAVSCYRTAIAIAPDFAEAHFNLGNTLRNMDRFSESIDSYNRAISFDPVYAEAHNNLGNVLKDIGRIDEALASYRAATRIKPDYLISSSNLLLALNYSDDVTQDEIELQSAAWGAGSIEHPLAAATFDNPRDPDRLIKVGFVSPDMRNHSVSYFFEPLLATLVSSSVETFCYADVVHPNETTRRLQSASAHWRDTTAMTDKELEQKIRDDRIDILIDLAGHTKGNRLLVFSRKPAPIQISWLGYPNTTGLAAMDFRFGDPTTDPVDVGCETLIRLPRGFFCYRPPEDAPPCRHIRTGESVRFGSFNNVAKMSPVCIALWSRVMSNVANSHLVLKSRVFADSDVRAQFVRLFERHGIHGDRLSLQPFSASIEEHLDAYGDIDVCLDPLPYNGTTTTCEALWMGVPVVTLRGDHHRGRVGASILSRVGLDECIARDADEFVKIATRLANDDSRRTKLRAVMRENMISLCDAPAFASDFEAALRSIWRTWCQN